MARRILGIALVLLGVLAAFLSAKALYGAEAAAGKLAIDSIYLGQSFDGVDWLFRWRFISSLWLVDGLILVLAGVALAKARVVGYLLASFSCFLSLTPTVMKMLGYSVFWFEIQRPYWAVVLVVLGSLFALLYKIGIRQGGAI